MFSILIAIVTIGATMAVWIISIQRRLVSLEDNIKNSMRQIGVQLSARFDALAVILSLAKAYANHESEVLIGKINKGRRSITAISTQEDLLYQEQIICEALEEIDMITSLCPEIKNCQSYNDAMDAMQIFDNMVRTSRLIYNDSVFKFNGVIQIWPVSMVAIMLGFRQKNYLTDKGRQSKQKDESPV